MTTYLVTANINCSVHAMLNGYQSGDRVSTVGYFDVTADDPTSAAEKLFAIGNRMDTDDNGKSWPSTVRSISVGDVLYIAGEAPGDVTVLACASVGWTAADLPTNACQVPLADANV